MSLSKKNITIIVLAGCLAAILLGRAATGRMMAHLEKLDGQIAEYTNRLNQAINEFRDNLEYEDKWQEIKSFEQEPVMDRKNRIMGDLQDLAKKQGIVITNTGEPIEQPMENNDKYQVIRYTYKFSTNLSDMVEFISQLDSSGELLCLERLKISRISVARTSRFERSLQSTKPLDLSVGMTISTPSALPAGAIGKGIVK